MSGDTQQIRQRRTWVELYAQTGDAGLVCRRCGISRPTLRMWWRRYQAGGLDGLRSHSRRPQTFGRKALSQKKVGRILSLRRKRKLGPRRIQGELLRLHRIRCSTATIWKVLHRHRCAPLRRKRRPSAPHRYSRPVPGDRVQLDTFKVAPGLIQYTAVDDCTRLRVLGLYARRTAKNAVHFLEERVVGEFPFPVQRVQTDRGGEFFALTFQRALRRHAIKFRPNRPRAPHLNGKVERSRQTDWVEFYATADLKDPALSQALEEWQFFYNWQRPHSSLSGKTPMDRCCELLDKTPLCEEVSAHFNPSTERFRDRDFSVDSRLATLRR